MQAFAEEGKRLWKKQRLSVAQIDRHLDGLLDDVEATKQKLVEKQEEYRRKKSRRCNASHPNDNNSAVAIHSTSSNTMGDDVVAGGDKDVESTTISSVENDEQEQKEQEKENVVEEEDEEMEHIVQEFIRRVRLLNVDKHVADELKMIHTMLSKYAKQIDKEAELELPPHYRECFIELHAILNALKQKEMEPALAWARKYRKDLRKLNINIEFELVRLKYVDMVENCTDVMDAVKFANDELSFFHDTHAKDVGRLMSCVLFKDKLNDSPYKDLFHDHRWEDIQNAVIRACCRLRHVPYQSYLHTCLSAGVSALPAMRKLVSVMDSKVTDWSTLEELPVEIPIPSEFRFHNVFSCPVSKEESSPSNPPTLLKCGHVICKSCVKRISLNMTRRFKCPTCPMEQTEAETRELFF